MAPGWVHELDAKILGYNPMVNYWIDYPVRWLGPNHRIMFHTLTAVIIIGFIVDGWDGVRGGISHLILDDMLTEEECEMLLGIFQKKLMIEFMTHMAPTKEETEDEQPPKAIVTRITPKPEPKIIPDTPAQAIINATPVSQLKRGRRPRAISITPVSELPQGKIISVTPAPQPTETPPLLEEFIKYILL